MKTRLFLQITLLIVSASTCGFNLETHGFLTQEAFNKSLLSGLTPASADLYFRLGFDRLDIKHPFKRDAGAGCKYPGISLYEEDEYLDARGTWLNAAAPDASNVVSRCPTIYEQRSMPPDYSGLLPSPAAAIGPLGPLRFEGWLMRGAIREDDLKLSNKILASDNLVWFIASLKPDVHSQKAWFLLRDIHLVCDIKTTIIKTMAVTLRRENTVASIHSLNGIAGVGYGLV
jgi:hypothetical protein